MEIYLLNISFDFEYLPLLIVVAIAWFVPMLLSIPMGHLETITNETWPGLEIQSLMANSELKARCDKEYMRAWGRLMNRRELAHHIDVSLRTAFCHPAASSP